MELPSVPNDTHPAIERRVIEELRRLSPEQKLAQTMALVSAAEELAVAGIRLREGELSDAELRLRLAKLRYDPELVARAEVYRARRR
jgi:rRNA-processing protein FCF1